MGWLQVQPSDWGDYQCQINTTPLLTRVVRLEERGGGRGGGVGPGALSPGPAARPTTRPDPANTSSSTVIVGAPQIMSPQDSLVNLTCLVTAPRQPDHVVSSIQ